VRVVLRTDVEHLGHKGDLLDVTDGYARNYLVPRGMAIKATKGVASAVHDQFGIELDRRVIDLAEPIRDLGATDVVVRLHPDVAATVHVEVHPE